MKLGSDTYLQPIKDLKWCTGCGHWKVLRALNKALVKLALPKENIVIVTDIGCIGLADRFFKTNAFHGLHGRAITYATGIKLANPDLNVIVLMGDGACGIGGTHVVNAARRNIGITIIVCNNFNYGMTGGQQSITTPLEGLTVTSPYGNIEAPLDVCALGIAGQASWVARIAATNSNKDKMVDLLTEALRYNGFAMLDVWEICTGRFQRINALNEGVLQRKIHEWGFKEYKQSRSRPEFSKEYRKRTIKGAQDQPSGRIDLTPKFNTNLKRSIKIKVAGSAGQAIQTAAIFFGGGAVLSGLYATQRNTFPMTQRSGHSIAEMIISPNPIGFTAVSKPDYLIITSGEGLKENLKLIPEMQRKNTIYIDENLKPELPRTKAKKCYFPAHRSLKLDNKASPIIGLTNLLQLTNIYPIKAFQEACERIEPSYAVKNIKVIEKTLESIK